MILSGDLREDQKNVFIAFRKDFIIAGVLSEPKQNEIKIKKSFLKHFEVIFGRILGGNLTTQIEIDLVF